MFERDEQAFVFDVTPVENLFLQEYMPAAKGDYVKVYLLGLMHSLRPGDTAGVRDLAGELGLPDGEVEAALRYWERRGLVRRLSDAPPRYRFFHAGQRMLAGSAPAVDEEFAAFAEDVYAAFGDRRRPGGADIALAYEWVAELGLPREVVLLLLNHCIVARGVNFSFRKAEPLAVRLKEEGVRSCEEAEESLRRSQAAADGARRVLRRLGKRRQPSEDEIALYALWTGEWGFSPDDVLAACAETTKGDPTMAYLNGILRGLRLRRESVPGDAPAPGGVEAQLQREQQEAAPVRRLLQTLGVKAAPTGMIREIYRGMRETYPEGVIELAAREAARAGGKLDDVQALLDAWKKKGLTGEEQVREYIGAFHAANALLARLFEACGHDKPPTARDRERLAAWRAFGMDDETLLLAASLSRDAQNKPAYLHKVLSAWHSQGVRTAEQARAAAGAHQARPDTPARPAKEVAAHRYQQRDYTPGEMEALSVDLIEEAKKARAT